MVIATVALYLLAGLVVAQLLRKRASSEAAAGSAGTFLVRALLWPAFAAWLAPVATQSSDDESRIRAAEGALASALKALGGALGDGLTLEMRRVEALGKATRAAAAKKAELDRLLTAPEHDTAKLESELARLQTAGDQSQVSAILAQRLAHVYKLEKVRAQTAADLDRALARAGELATRLTLLRYDSPSRTGVAATAQQLTQSIDELCSVLTEVQAS